MKRALILLLLVLVACKTEPQEYFQENFSDVPAIGIKCTIGSIDYYEKGDFLFHENAAGSRIVYTEVGEYLKPKGYPRWQFKLFLDKNDSLYTKTRELMDLGITPNGEEIICVDANSLPQDFSEWLSSHEKLYNIKKADEAMEIA